MKNDIKFLKNTNIKIVVSIVRLYQNYGWAYIDNGYLDFYVDIPIYW